MMDFAAPSALRRRKAWCRARPGCAREGAARRSPTARVLRDPSRAGRWSHAPDHGPAAIQAAAGDVGAAAAAASDTDRYAAANLGDRVSAPGLVEPVAAAGSSRSTGHTFGVRSRAKQAPTVRTRPPVTCELIQQRARSRRKNSSAGWQLGRHRRFALKLHRAWTDLGIIGLALGNDGRIGRLSLVRRTVRHPRSALARGAWVSHGPAVGARPGRDLQSLIDREMVACHCMNARKAFTH
jgi:hypothetical protein